MRRDGLDGEGSLDAGNVADTNGRVSGGVHAAMSGFALSGPRAGREAVAGCLLLQTSATRDPQLNHYNALPDRPSAGSPLYNSSFGRLRRTEICVALLGIVDQAPTCVMRLVIILV
jgi:hypothetical protein